MNYVELVDRLRVLSAASGHEIKTVQQGMRPEAIRLAQWVQDAWVDIQLMHDDWKFRQEVAAHVLEVNSNVLNTSEYQSSQIAEWKVDQIRISQPGEGISESQLLNSVPWDTFKNQQGLMVKQRDKPCDCSVRPQDNAVVIYPAADKAYPVFYEYIREPQMLVHDDDEPIIPEHFHRLIVYEAMLSYGFYEVATEVLEEAKRHRTRLLQDLRKRMLPGITAGSL